MIFQNSMATDRKNFSQEEINEVWEKAIPQPKNNPDLFRKDYAGAWIRKDAYGEHSEYGWEIDHIKPLVIDGSHDISNLEPLQWQNNRTKGDDFPHWNTSISANDVHNTEMHRSWCIKN